MQNKDLNRIKVVLVEQKKTAKCHYADMQAEAHGSGDHRQGALSGTMLPIAHRFAQKFNFSKVIGTQGAVNYNSFFTNFTTPGSSNYMRPYPEDGKWINIVRRK